MSLIVYSRYHKPPEDVHVIRSNDAYFNMKTVLHDTDLEAEILEALDKAKYCSPISFYGRSSDTVALTIECLSTGAKTLLNIISHTDQCFDLCECSDNVLDLIPKVTDGMVYWDLPIIAYAGDEKCDILYGDKHYTDFYKFLADTMNADDD